MMRDLNELSEAMRAEDGGEMSAAKPTDRHLNFCGWPQTLVVTESIDLLHEQELTLLVEMQ